MVDLTLAQAVLSDRQIATIVTDRDLKVVGADGVCAVLGDCPDENIGRSLLDLVPELIGSEDALALILSGELLRLHLPWVNRDLPDGSVAYLDMTVLPRRDARGRIAGLIHVTQDLTWIALPGQQLTQQRNELRLLQEQLNTRNVELEAANAELRRLGDVKSAFVSIAAHELRTPLASILGYLEMLLDGDAGALNSKQKDYVELMQQAAQRLLHITNDLLDMTRLESGSLALHLRPTDLMEVVEQVAAEQAPRAAARSQRILLDAPPHLPAALCDPTRAVQVLDNLLSNACKYSHPGGVIVVSLAQDEQDGFLRVAIADQGVGIADEDRPHLFEPFFRTATARKAGVSGTGLGLFIARSLVELHGGRIWYESRPQLGTTFYVTFPMADKPAMSPHPVNG